MVSSRGGHTFLSRRCNFSEDGLMDQFYKTIIRNQGLQCH